jgi:hypothetical protein
MNFGLGCGYSVATKMNMHLSEVVVGKFASSSVCMMKNYRIHPVYVKKRNGVIEIGVQAISLPIADGYIVPWFHMTWVSAEEPRAQATSMMVAAMHFNEFLRR